MVVVGVVLEREEVVRRGEGVRWEGRVRGGGGRGGGGGGVEVVGLGGVRGHGEQGTGGVGVGVVGVGG